jgi:hypothetical protein
MLYRVITAIQVPLMHVNPHGIWVPVLHVGGAYLTSAYYLPLGAIAVPVGKWIPGKDVFLAEGRAVAIPEKFLSEVIDDALCT